ncbi:DUF563 domain-containing protein [Polynucleobacter sp. TSB-Sco08W16]|uniref:glycosyltransferase family 61 protein n=1 Tax=Polynucleobacter sp. TSB-Sco08W16 TaxID=1758374 RepID=UPI001BFD2BAC|nr:glycosyltransferase family 61 protein [Polynucleobacter sp. TSB-Sco08W16]
MFSKECISLINEKDALLHHNASEDSLFFETPSTNSGFKINDLIEGVEVGGSILAHLTKVMIKDSSLLILVRNNLSLTEGYGNRRWAEYQLNKWPSQHNYPLCMIQGENLLTLKQRIKIYSIDKKIQKIPIPAIYLSVRPNDKNIYHWVMETLIRLKCLDDLPELKNIPLIVRDQLSDFQKSTLRLMGVDNKLIITNGESFEIEDLFFPSIPSTPTQHPGAMHWLRDKFLNRMMKPANTKKRLYISRIDSNRQVANEDEIFSYLEGLGYEKLIMSEISAEDQINYFRAAESIVIPHGAAGTHLLFVPPTCKVIELHSPKWVNHCYLSLCASLGISYKWILGSQHGNDMDYVVNLNELKALISHNS